MKVFFWVGGIKGGYEQRTLNFALFLKEKFGIVPTIGLYSPNKSIDLPQAIFPPLFRTNKLTGFNNLFISIKLSKSFLNQFDLVYGKFLRSTRAKKISRVAGDSRRTYQPSLLSRLVYGCLLQFDKLIYRWSDAVVVCSIDAERFIKDIGGNPVLSSNYVDTDIFRPMRNKQDSIFRVLFVGRADPIKNFPALKKACDGLSVMLVTAGLDDWLSLDDLNKKYNSVDLVVLPSFYESYGSVVLEALATGTPVLVSDNVTAGRELFDYVSVCGTDWRSIRSMIHLIAINYNYVLKKTQRGTDYVRSFLNKEAVLGKEWSSMLEVK